MLRLRNTLGKSSNRSPKQIDILAKNMLASLQLVLCRVAAVKRLRVHQP